MTYPANFRGRAKKIEDLDLPRVGAMIGVGEDEIRAIIEVETKGSGFDSLGRPLILFEPHKFYAHLSGDKRTKAMKEGLACQKWGQIAYGKTSEQYGKLERALKIDATAALKACSWGLGQVLGENHIAAGYSTVQEMVEAMCDDEDNHLEAMVNFIKNNHLDDEVRAHNWAAFARGYNGPQYKKNNYDTKLAQAYAKWKKIKDTPYTPEAPAKEEPRPDVAIEIPAPAPVVIDAPVVAIPAPAEPAPPVAEATQRKSFAAILTDLIRGVFNRA